MRRTWLTRVIAVLAVVSLQLAAASPALAEGPVTLASGAGWITGVAGGKATFGFVVRVNGDGTVSGRLSFVDHNTGFRVQSTSIVAAAAEACVITFEGEDGTSVQFAVAASDGGEPGAGRDAFTIQAGTGYANSGIIQGGNIQMPGEDCP